ncbi:unnamed protein product [Caenorhabditis auriculariae]|uniref:Uncharacterized protein n=1 Tax=Caenorhabditis auriculariae TaxID=2777116 RepID=A0A8S1H0P8_9PELO|nr:unnamed protein product [Caenorhabditis auriculariae]
MSESSPPSRHQMGLVACTCYVFANIVGAGIFITPGPIFAYTSSIGLALLVWAGCGLISIIGGICYIELGTSILEPGCDFAYAVYVGWESLAFSFMWVGVLMSYPASAAIQAHTFGQYIVAGLAPVVPIDPQWQELVERGLGFALILLLTVLNFYAIDKYASKFQIFVTAAKLLALAVIIFTGFYYLIVKGWTHNFENIMAGSNWNPGSIALAFYGASWSFSGWDILNYGTPEIYKPRRTMPIALLGGIALVTLIYLAMNVSYCVVMTPQQISNSSAVAVEFAQATLGSFSYAIPFMTALMLSFLRFTHAAAREGHLPRFLSCINTGSNSPRAALLFQLVCMVLVSFVNTNDLINYVTFIMFGQRLISIAALFWIRYKKLPVAAGAIEVPIIFSIVFWLFTAALIVVPFVEDTKNTIIGIIFVAVGLAIYYVFVKPTNTPNFLIRLNDGMTRVTCRLLFSAPDLRRVAATTATETATDEELHSLNSADCHKRREKITPTYNA